MSEPRRADREARAGGASTAPPRRRGRLGRWAWRAFLVLAGGLVVLVGLLGYGIATERGSRSLLRLAGGFVPGTLALGEVRGRLAGPLELDGVRYENHGLRVTIARLEVDWRPRALWRRRLDVAKLDVAGVRIRLAPPASQPKESDGRLVPIHLPLNVVVRSALVRDVEIEASAGPASAAAAPIRLERVALEATSERHGDVLHVRSLAVEGPTFSLSASGELSPVGDYPVALDTRATWRAPSLPPFAIAGRLEGTLERLGIDLRLSRPFAARVEGDVLTPMREVGFDLSAHVEGFDPRVLDATYPAARIDRADLALRGTLDDLASNGLLEGRYEGVGAGVLDYRVRKRGNAVTVERLHFASARDARLEAHGTVQLAEAPAPLDTTRLDLAARWRGLGLPLDSGAPAVVAAAGEASVQGSLGGYRLAVKTTLAGPNLPPGRWEIEGRGDREKLEIGALHGELLGGDVDARLAVAWKPRVAWDARVRATDLDPAADTAHAAARDYPGRVAVAASTTGTLGEAGPVGTVTLETVRGTIRDRAIAGHARVELAGDRYRLAGVELRAGSARLTASGTLTAQASDLDWALAAPDLAEILARGGGAFAAHGHLSGPWASPRVRATAEGKALAFGTSGIASVRLAADVDLRSNGRIAIDADAAGVSAGGRRFETVTLDGSGTRATHELALALAAPEGSLALALAGGLAGDGTWSGTLRRLDLTNERTGKWRLARPAPLAASPERASLRDFCWLSGAARLCAEGDWSRSGAWSVSGTLAALPFSLVEPLLSPDLDLTGTTSGTFRGARSARGEISADLDLRPGPGEIRSTTASGATATVRFERGSVRAATGAQGLSAHAELTFVDTGSVRADLELPGLHRVGVPLGAQGLRGRVRADFASLRLLATFFPALADPQGSLSADLALGGTVSNPAVGGRLRLAGGRVDVPRYGLELRQIELSATSEGNGPLSIRGHLRSGEGALTLAGTAALDGATGRLTVEGTRFEAVDTRQARVVVSPRLAIVKQGTRVDVTGEVDLPRVTLEQEKRARAAVPVSADVVLAGSTEEAVAGAGAASLAVHARVRVILGDQVSIKALGFSGKPQGSLLLIEEPGKPTSAVGELQIEAGVYKSYGQDLTLERGRLIFGGGPIDDPGLDLRAFRKADDGTIAGIDVRGTLRSPQATIYSEPPMAESDALAYLLLGHPLDQSTGDEGDLLANAATSLGLKGGNLLAKKLAARFGLEEARIESTGGLQESSLVVGKYLSPRLYVTYGIGLFEPLSTFKIRYRLNRRWSLQAEQSGTATGADLLYTVERGRGKEAPAPMRREGVPPQAPADGD